MLLKFTGTIFENLFLLTKSSESECLAIGYTSLKVYGVVAIHAQLLVLVRGFNILVSFNLVILQADGRV